MALLLERRPRAQAFPWWLVTQASPWVATLRQLREMRYLWQQPVRMANGRLVAALGAEPHTPRDMAVQATLQGLGGLPATGLTAPGKPRSPGQPPA